MNQEVEDFINQNQEENISHVALLLSKKPSLPKEYIINQINGKRKAKKKLPFLNIYPNYRYPRIRAVEQSSSEKTAKYKANIAEGNILVDLSGGMGIDSYFFAKKFDKVHYVELNKELFENTILNFETVFKTDNILTHNTDALTYLNNLDEQLDCIYIDPDRRVSKSKAFMIKDCEPNVGELLPIIFQKSNNCLIKLSPILDISQALTQFEYCKEVHVVSYQNECKELLFLLEKNYNEETQIIAIDLDKEESDFSFRFSQEREMNVNFSMPQSYLYDPNTSILKSGAFKSIANKFGLNKLAKNTHIYTSDELIDGFPGRTFSIKAVLTPKKGYIKKANVIAKNFSLGAEEVKKKYKIQDGGHEFIYACALENKKKVFIHCEKV